MTECIAKNGGQNIAYYLAIALDAWGEAARREGAAGEREACLAVVRSIREKTEASIFGNPAEDADAQMAREIEAAIRARTPAGDATAKEGE
jgi:hypothetical protein